MAEGWDLRVDLVYWSNVFLTVVVKHTLVDLGKLRLARLIQLSDAIRDR